jgi:hypothetical protein
MKAGKVKQVLSGVGTSGRGRVNGEGEGGGIWFMYIAYVCDNRTMKPAEIVLRRGEGK